MRPGDTIEQNVAKQRRGSSEFQREKKREFITLEGRAHFQNTAAQRHLSELFYVNRGY